MRSGRYLLGWSCLAFGVLWGNGVAQDALSAVPAPVLGCLVQETAPNGPGVADEGGYLFEYQSLRGITEDDRACTVYRFRNTPGKPPTPTRWLLGDVVVVDKVRLPRCPGRATCEWSAFAKYFPGHVDANLSTIGYGLNADAYHELAPTFMAGVSIRDDDIAEAHGVLASSVGTEIAGTFSGPGDLPVSVHLIVKSRFETDAGLGTQLIYEIDDLSGQGMLGPGALEVSWDALDAIPAVRAALDLPVAGAGAAVVRTDDRRVVTIHTERFAFDERFALTVRVAGQDTPLVSVEMPAYVPVALR